ncbi:type VI secretion system Vgr family protein [Zobellia laminariae]|uniref:type VI secretion system Vgr family protein n=1 Tax=Zobellia laminariae TaxID=248906 RepID=UPI0026F45137|nr:phage baseplate assembly protein V [Zobellia laminariae]WKX76162.1 phage baseplate assembly protein V [Zobellia laminariae]
MSKIVEIKLILNGNTFLPNSGYSVSVEQAIGGHSGFRVSFPAHATETYAGPLMKNALGFIGKKMSIGLNGGDMEFTGIITNVDLQKGAGAAGTLVISGHGPAVLLANSVQCFSYEEGTSLSQVVEDTLKGHSTDILKKSIGTGTDVTLPYTVQYNESDLSFLQRLCSRYGVWLYHNGLDFCIGRAGSTTLSGVYGMDVLSFNLSTSLREQVFDIKGHDWVNDTLLEATSSSHVANSSHPYLAPVKGESDAVFNKKGSYDYTVGQHEYSAQAGLDTAAKVNTLGRASGMVTASGTSELVAMRVGDTLELEGLNFTDPTKQDSYGSYDIIKVVHRFDHSGHYTNSFEGVPQGTEHLPYSNSFAAPRAADQRGLVLDNADSEGLGRIKVQFPWQKPMGTSTPWIKVPTPYSGGGKGFYFIPEKDEEVLVSFEAGNPEKPYVSSAGYNANAKSDFYDPDNNIKAIKTRSGHLIELNDTDGEESITITDKNSNKIFLNTKDSSISISAPGNLSLTADTIDIKAKNALTMKSEESTIAIGAKDAIGMHSTEATVQISGKENIDIRSTEAEVKIKAKTTTNIVGNDKVDILSGNELAMHGKSTSKLTGGEVHVNKG